VALLISVICLVAVAGLVKPLVALVLSLAVLMAYLAILAAPRPTLKRLGLPAPWTAWLISAIVEEEVELEVAIHPRRGTRSDTMVALGALLVVVVASIAMERGASSLGRRYAVAEIVVGGLVLAAVTSLPNAVAAVYLARRGRGAAALSTALNSNTINVVGGLLIPATVIGLAKPSSSGFVITGWYLGLTFVTLALAYVGRGLGRAPGGLIIGAYVLFVIVLLAIT
jgi:cation:H+ antiporter